MHQKGTHLLYDAWDKVISPTAMTEGDLWKQTIVTQCPEPEETRHKEQRAGRDRLDLLIHQRRLSGVELPHWRQLLPCQRVYVTRLPKGQGGFKTGKAASVYSWDKEKHWQRHRSPGLVSYCPLRRKIFFCRTPVARPLKSAPRWQKQSLLLVARARKGKAHLC